MKSLVSEIFPALIEAGKTILEIYRTDFSVAFKSKDDPVTQADLRANEVITSAISQVFSQHGILSEETEDSTSRLEKESVWILDPIDGTREFVAKNGEFALSLGLSVHHKPSVGFILNPARGEWMIGERNQFRSFTHNPDLFLSESGKTEIENLFRTEWNSPTPKPLSNPLASKSRIVVSRSEWKDNLFGEDFWKDYEIIPMGSIAYKLGLLARGDYDLSISLRPKREWDICGGVAVCQANELVAKELKTEKNYLFNQKETKTIGLIAGKADLVETFLNKHRTLLRDKCLSDWK